MKHSDGRVKATNESLSNIRMLKLYSWSDIFFSRVLERRAEELAWIWKRMQNGQLVVTSIYFFPAILNALVFAVYIGLGNTLSLDIAFTVVTLLNIIRHPLAFFPEFFGQFLEFRVSMKRIASFLCVDEVNMTIIRQVQ